MGKPPTLLPGKAYIHITSPLPASSIQNSLSHPQYRLDYVGPVGELEGEHIFQVIATGSNDIAERASIPEGDLLKAVKEVNGVKGAKVLEKKQRAKRDEF